MLGTVVIAVHVLDDNFVPPQPGTSAGDHLVSGLVPLAVLGFAVWGYPGLRGGHRGAIALICGEERMRRLVARPACARLCPLLCPPAPSTGTVEPKHTGIIIRVAGVRVPPPASRSTAEL
jgi:hypothetical protein